MATPPGANQEQSSPASPEGVFQASEIAIQTMQDDLKAQPPATRPPAPQPAESTEATPGSTSTKPAPQLDMTGGKTPPPVSPPAPEKSAPPAKSKSKKKSGRKTVIVLGVVLALVVAAGGFAAWFFLINPAPEELREGTEEIPPITNTLELFPGTATSITHYNLSQPSHRQRLQLAFSKDSSTPTSDLLAGNPAAILNDPAIQELFYVTLPDNPRPYVIIPRTSNTEQIAAQQTDDQVINIGDWYVMHQLAATDYQTALAAGNLLQQNSNLGFASDFPVQWLLRKSVFESLDTRTNLLTNGQNQADMVAINGLLSGDGQLVVVTNDSVLSLASSNSASEQALDAPESLLSFVPEDSGLVWSGQSFADDLELLQDRIELELDSEHLEPPTQAAMISRFTEQYAYYERQGPDGRQDIGLVIDLPAEDEDTLEAGNLTLEGALLALVPRITGRTTTPSVTFTSSQYAGVPLRYVNFTNDTQTLDYAVVEGKLIITSSKEGMFAAIDTIQGTKTAISESEAWQPYLTQLTQIAGEDITVITTTSSPRFDVLLPNKDIVRKTVTSFSLNSEANKWISLFAAHRGATALPQEASPSPQTTPASFE